MNSSEKLGQPERLADEIDCTDFQEADDQVVVLDPGENDRGYRHTFLVPLSQNLAAEEPGHQLVDYRKVELAIPPEVVGFLAIGRHDDLVVFRLEGCDEKGRDHFRVVGDEDPLLFRQGGLFPETVRFWQASPHFSALLAEAARIEGEERCLNGPHLAHLADGNASRP